MRCDGVTSRYSPSTTAPPGCGPSLPRERHHSQPHITRPTASRMPRASDANTKTATRNTRPSTTPTRRWISPRVGYDCASAGVVQWQNGSFPSCIRGFDSLHPLHNPESVNGRREIPGRRAGGPSAGKDENVELSRAVRLADGGSTQAAVGRSVRSDELRGESHAAGARGGVGAAPCAQQAGRVRLHPARTPYAAYR